MNLIASLDSSVPSLDFDRLSGFWTSGFDSISIVFDLLSVSRSLAELYFSHSIKCSFFWPWENEYIVNGFDSISITQFPAMICSVSAEGSLNRRLTRFRSFFFWLWGNHFCLICVHLLLVYHSVQLSHTWSDFSRSLRVMISETRILFHFILVSVSSTLMIKFLATFVVY